MYSYVLFNCPSVVCDDGLVVDEKRFRTRTILAHWLLLFRVLAIGDMVSRLYILFRARDRYNIIL